MNDTNTPADAEADNNTKTPITDADHLIEPETEHTEPPVTEKPEQATPPATENVSSPAPSPATAKEGHTSGGLLVLQWLSYAFWLWFSISVSVLAGIVINYFVSGSKSYQWGNELAYPLASVIIMLVIALVADKVYAKHEPAKKSGGANVIMLLHVVPFILIGIGALVTVVFSCITMLLNSDPLASVDGPLKIMAVSLIVALLFGLISARAFYGGNSKVRRITWLAAAVLAIGFIIAAIAGPAMDAIRTKDDRLVEQALPSLASDIRTYASENNKLPAQLGDVTHEDTYLSAAVQKLIDSKLVTYKANTIASASSSYDPTDVNVSSCVDTAVSGVCYDRTAKAPYAGVKRFYYQLCTTYKREKKSAYSYTDDANYTVGSSAGVAADYRSSYVTSIDSHPAGEVCYNLYADGKYASVITPTTLTE